MAFKSTKIRAKDVQDLAAKHYEPGRQDRCFLWVYRTVIKPQMGISERTFWRMMRADTTEIIEEDKRQLKLF